MTSLSGKFTTAGKVFVCAMMIRGRHRALPYAVDRSVILPGDGKQEDAPSTLGPDKAAKLADHLGPVVCSDEKK